MHIIYVYIFKHNKLSNKNKGNFISTLINAKSERIRKKYVKSEIKKTQDHNFKQYLKSICDYESLIYKYNKCLKTGHYSDIPYMLPNSKECNIVSTEIKSCQMLYNNLYKEYYRRQKEYLKNNIK